MPDSGAQGTRAARRGRWVSACSAVVSMSGLLVIATLPVAGQRRDFPARPPGDPAAIERGHALYGVTARSAMAPTFAAGDGGPSLLRAATVLDDQKAS